MRIGQWCGVGVFAVLLLGFASSAGATAAEPASAYDFSFKTLHDEEPLPLSRFKGQVLLVVNTASQCGFTPQYGGLEKLYQRYKERGLVILGVPSNDFGGQEPGGSQDIARFCQINYGVSFPMAAKEVVSGDEAHPFYRWAQQELGFGTAPKWNFHKYLIDRHGKLADYFHSTTKPDDDAIRQAVERLLGEKPAAAAP